MRTQWTRKLNQDADSSCSCDRGLHRYFWIWGEGGVEPPTPPPLRTPLVNSYGCFQEVEGSEAVQQFFVYSDTEDDAERKLLRKVSEDLPNDMRHMPQEIDQ